MTAPFTPTDASLAGIATRPREAAYGVDNLHAQEPSEVRDFNNLGRDLRLAMNVHPI
jgi:hypothetical protein